MYQLIIVYMCAFECHQQDDSDHRQIVIKGHQNLNVSERQEYLVVKKKILASLLHKNHLIKAIHLFLTYD